ncbi:glycosyltransferase [Ectopseudomonas oleovorans]|uniref:Glycosyltransferase n=2 Tax=Ectopseudomonas oleovorans TaxID=301 RepID=A0A3R8VTA5_ECTOL|nr:glycosyltransferase [Pseudomonas oleovorans]
MATYNGCQFITQQIASILSELDVFDEVVIVDDCSTDNTLELINSFADARVKCFKNSENLGHVKSFEKAISLASGDYIFLSDQDDVWIPGRLSIMLKELVSRDKSVVASDFFIFGEDLKHYYKNSNLLPMDASEIKIASQLFMGRIPYFGCAMGFRRDLLDTLLPFPAYVEAHDLWLAWNGLLNKGIAHLNSETLYHRIHSNNLTPHKRRHIGKVIMTRCYFLKMISVIYFRKLKIGLSNG